MRLHQWTDDQGAAGFGRISGELIRRAPIGATVSARIDPNPGFNPPDDPARPILMIGAGSGVAPFPGFLDEREASGRAGPAWLIFGNRRRDGDFLWSERWRAALASGSLTRLDAAFSRDADDGRRVRMPEGAGGRRRRLADRAKALVYVCGRPDMARDVVDALKAILSSHGGWSARKRARRSSRRSPTRASASTPSIERAAALASDREADAAAAGGDRVGVLDLERLAHQVVDEIELRAAHHLQRDRVDDDARRRRASRRNRRRRAVRVDVEGVLEARAAAALDRDAQRRAGSAASTFLQAARRGGADRQGRRGGCGDVAHAVHSRGRQSAGRSL